MGTCGQEEEKCTNLIEEADAGQNLLDALLELTVGGTEGDVGSVGNAAATAASQQGDDAATPLGDDRARIASIREGATRAVVGDDGELARRELDIGELVMTNEGLQAAHATRSRSCSPPVLEHRHGRVAVGVDLLGVENLVQRNDAAEAKQAMLRVSVALAVGDVGEHEVQESLLLELVACVKYK